MILGWLLGEGGIIVTRDIMTTTGYDLTYDVYIR